MEAIDVLPLDGAVSSTCGRIRADRERRGSVIGNNDLWIAAHALSLGLTLVTANMREFMRVDRLVVEDWTA
ncbi:PIN domain-containing protein [Salinarimonas chemoclinalis]|uniref:PIN domain-containing protein n=1 Tax=Salinarimonas chemoclinalis TaxID=3241599 RepID=UPI0035589052